MKMKINSFFGVLGNIFLENLSVSVQSTLKLQETQMPLGAILFFLHDWFRDG